MPPYTPDTGSLWLERSRLDGMLLSAVSYGIFFLLTIQATVALVQKPSHGGQIAHHRWTLLSYVWITFVLATIGFAGNARYTEMIWIDLRSVSGGPTTLILDEMNYWMNMMALACYFVMEWFMQTLLLYRCFILWNWQKHVMVPMCTLFAAMVAMSILVLVETSGAVFYNINSELVYLCLQVGLTFIYTLLVAGRLFVHRKKMRDTLEPEHIGPYKTAAIMVVESAALYSVIGIIFIFSFALRSYISNLVLLSVSHVQGIAQLLILIRVARGRAFQRSTSRTQPVHPSTNAFLGSPSNKRELERTDPHASIADMECGIPTLRQGTSEKPVVHSSTEQLEGV